MAWLNQNTTRATSSTHQTTGRSRSRNVSRNVLAEDRQERAALRQERAADRARISREARDGGLLSPAIAQLRNQLSLAQETTESQPRRRPTLSESIESGANSIARSLDRRTRETTRFRRMQAEQQANQRLPQPLASASRWLARQEQNMNRGISDGLESLITTVGGAVAHPSETLGGLHRLSEAIDPNGIPRLMVANQQTLTEVMRENSEVRRAAVDGVVGGFAQSYQDHGVAGLFGRGMFEALGSLLGGGSSYTAQGLNAGSKVSTLRQVSDSVNQSRGRAVEGY